MSIKDNVKMIVCAVVVLSAIGFFSIYVEKWQRPCPKGQVKIDAKCYEIGATYSRVNGVERKIT